MKKKHNNDLSNQAISGGLFETVSRHGSAGAEFLKGLRGIDYETGQVFDRSLQQISDYKINPEYVERNIKQQAGFSAEVVSVSKRNAEAIIEGRPERYSRSEDLANYGKNDTAVDIVELLDGQERATSQMKFVGDPEGLLKKIACGEGGGKNDLSRYMQVDKLELPSEQVEEMKAHCRAQSEKLKQQAEYARTNGKTELAEKLEKQSANYEQLEGKITDAGLSTDQAVDYRLNPDWETVKDIASVSHRAGIEGAKFGAAIGGGISAITNAIAVYSGNKELNEAITDTAKDTLVSAGVGYGTAFAGTAIKTYMQQSASDTFRALSKTGLPTAIVTACIAACKNVARYAQDEINEAQLAREMGMVATSMLSGAAFAALGQMAIPIPVVGGLIGSMIGYAVTNHFYQGFFNTLQEARLSAERRQLVEMKCAAAAALARRYEHDLKALFAAKVARLDSESRAMFAVLENPDSSAEALCRSMNRFAEMLGKKISISSMAELDKAMLSDDVLKI